MPSPPGNFMQICEIKLKKVHPDATLPTKAHDTDSGWDVYALKDTALLPEDNVVAIPTGLQLASITPGFEIQVRAKSGKVKKLSLMVSNAPGTVDNHYRGEIIILMHVLKDVLFKKGETFAQLVPVQIPQSTMAWTEEVTETVRGAGGFGSTDKPQ